MICDIWVYTNRVKWASWKTNNSSFFRQTSKKKSKFRFIERLWGKNTTGHWVPLQSVINVESVPMSWRHHVKTLRKHTYTGQQPSKYIFGENSRHWALGLGYPRWGLPLSRYIMALLHGVRKYGSVILVHICSHFVWLFCFVVIKIKSLHITKISVMRRIFMS